MSKPAEYPAAALLELLHRRTSVEDFDATRPLDEDEVRELVADAISAPSSFNIQHWRFVAVRRDADKRRLQECAFGQEQVSRAAVTFLVLGDLDALERMPDIMETAVDRGAMPEGKAAAWVRMAREIYADPVLARDEAIRSGSLAAMCLMLAAEARGLAAGALTGFDPEALRAAFGIDERHVPVMLLAVGHAAGRPKARMPRLAVRDVLRFDRWRK